MKVTAPFDAYVPALVEPMLDADPLNPDAGNVTEGETYDVPDPVGKSLVAQGWKQVGSSSSKSRVPKGKPAP